ncbi:histidine phosphatase family protein [Paenibacillus xerothermodurans]|uniref:histidine phosphatase family protein n=1 Tax=Paenibacillus xerothermodurans TaxID=1977292 RepID=UPI0024373F02|nr:histidine phosphatase family protein [Paenibacillus xerothermodurans]
MMRNVYVVRHCKADGQEPDARLTELGIQQAEVLAKFFLGKHIEFIISSPFERAYRTISPLADQIGVEVVLDDRLAERLLSSKNYPDWQDMLRKTFDIRGLRHML